MKKFIISALCVALLLSAAACSEDTKEDKDTTAQQTSAKASEAVDTDTAETDFEASAEHETEPEAEPHEYETIETPAAKVNKVVNADEMAMYNAVFFNNDESYINTEMTKTGIFTILYDAFSGVDRYYVWGYENDSSTNGWQWEFTVVDPATLPKVGSEVTVKGKFVNNDSALDKKWIENAEVSVVSEYTNALCKYDLTTMSPILSARVQVPNIINNLDKFNDKICLYAKVADHNMLTSTYDDLTWSVHTVEGTVLPEVGTLVTVVGTFDEHGQFVTETLNIE